MSAAGVKEECVICLITATRRRKMRTVHALAGSKERKRPRVKVSKPGMKFSLCKAVFRPPTKLQVLVRWKHRLTSETSSAERPRVSFSAALYVWCSLGQLKFSCKATTTTTRLYLLSEAFRFSAIIFLTSPSALTTRDSRGVP